MPVSCITLFCAYKFDRIYVFVCFQNFAGVLSRSENIKTLSLLVTQGQKIRILVENQGRLCFGHEIGENKAKI